MNTVKRLCLLLTVTVMLCCSVPSLAENRTPSVEVTGTVVNVCETPVLCLYSGTVAEIPVRAGSRVSAGDTIARLQTNKVYAAEDGTVHIFGTAGDSTEMLTARYGAAAYVEPDTAYSVSASTKYCYEAEANRIIHPGETVYLRSITTIANTGIGTVTQVSGTSFTVEITSGNFITGESTNIFRDPDFAASSRIGRGNIARNDYSLYPGEGIIVRFLVADGDHVEKGTLLYETVAGIYMGNTGADPTVIAAPADGIISTVSPAPGNTVAAGDTVCMLYPDDGMRVQAELDEEALEQIQEGGTVTVRFDYISGGEYTQTGTVEEISWLGAADETGESEESLYTAIIKLSGTAGIRYGMTVTVSN